MENVLIFAVPDLHEMVAKFGWKLLTTIGPLYLVAMLVTSGDTLLAGLFRGFAVMTGKPSELPESEGEGRGAGSFSYDPSLHGEYGSWLERQSDDWERPQIQKGEHEIDWENYDSEKDYW